MDTAVGTTATVQDVLACLELIIDPCSAASALPMNIVEMGLVKNVSISPDNKVTVELRLTSPGCYMVGYIVREAKRLIEAFPGLDTADIKADRGLEWEPDMIHPGAAKRRHEQLVALGLPTIAHAPTKTKETA
jgi:metal-sulfur cluster biosynthetic enzyme